MCVDGFGCDWCWCGVDVGWGGLGDVWLCFVGGCSGVGDVVIWIVDLVGWVVCVDVVLSF